MLKYTDTLVGFREVPDKIALLINISGCKCHCPGCHSKYLWEDIGNPLNTQTLDTLIAKNPGINCVCFMGGEEFEEIAKLAQHVSRKYYGTISIAWYTGHSFEEVNKREYLLYVNYLKVGPYVEELGPLDNPSTNQKMYEISIPKGIGADGQAYPLVFDDITPKFWH